MDDAVAVDLEKIQASSGEMGNPAFEGSAAAQVPVLDLQNRLFRAPVSVDAKQVEGRTLRGGDLSQPDGRLGADRRLVALVEPFERLG